MAETMEAPASPISRHINPWIIAIAVMLSTFMEVLDTTVVNVSLPHIAGSMSATVDEATWALTSYLVANAVILPITGWLATILGRKRLLMMAVTGFTVTSFPVRLGAESAFAHRVPRPAGSLRGRIAADFPSSIAGVFSA